MRRDLNCESHWKGEGGRISHSRHNWRKQWEKVSRGSQTEEDDMGGCLFVGSAEKLPLPPGLKVIKEETFMESVRLWGWLS